MKRSVHCLACATLIAACGSGLADGEWTGTITDSAGVAIVANPERGLWRDGQRWRIEEELRIGVADGEPEYQFGAIAWIDVDAEGRIYVLDQQAQNVRVFDGEGDYLRTIGRPGNGPGEFSPAVMAVIPAGGDTLFVPDAMQQRVHRFLADGTEVGSFPIPLTEGISTKWKLLPDGRLAQEVRPAPTPNQDPAAQQVVLVRAGDGAIVDTLLHLPLGQTLRFQGGTARVRLFEPEPLWDVGDDGRMIQGVNSDYRIEIRTPDGELARIVTRPFQRQDVTEADRQAFIDLFDEMFERQGVPPQARQLTLQTLEFADHYPAYMMIAAGPDGTLWVQHIQSAAEVAAAGGSFDAQNVGAPEWDVFDEDGRFLGVVAFPDRFQPFHFRGDAVYGLWRDDIDVQHVMRLRIVRPSGD